MTQIEIAKIVKPFIPSLEFVLLCGIKIAFDNDIARWVIIGLDNRTVVVPYEWARVIIMHEFNKLYIDASPKNKSKIREIMVELSGLDPIITTQHPLPV